MDADRSAAKRRASFGRAARLKREARAKSERAALEERRAAERVKAEQQRKADAIKAAEQRNALARKRAEQRRLERRRADIRKDFALQAEDRKAHDAKVAQHRDMATSKAVSDKRTAEAEQRRRDAEAYVLAQDKRQQAEQQQEHRRQTHRLRAQHESERTGFRDREAAAIVNHARSIRNIDIAERRALEALGVRQNSLVGRAVGLIRGGKHVARQEQAIIDRHEDERWRKHRDHEVKKDNLFWSEQAARLRHAAQRQAIAQKHQTEVREQRQSQDSNRPRLIAVRAHALMRANDNARQRQRENVRPTQAFGQAAEPSREIKR